MHRFYLFIFLLISTSAYAVGPSCNEAPISIEKLEEIVSSDSVKTMQDFLEKIPKDSMQLFTFVTNSLSLHRGEGEGVVSPMWPRVIRSTSDGKITISFVCDPRNPTYGKVEALYFDDKGKKLKSVSWNFGPKGKIIKPSDRIHKDPISCTSCHSGSDVQLRSDAEEKPSLKYNWTEYRTWGDCERNRGITVYGSNDDNVIDGAFRKRNPSSDGNLPKGCTEEKDLIAYKEEVADYQNFRKLQKNNACFGTLPWSKDSKDVNFPYKASNGYRDDIDRSRRPNLLLTHNYGQLMAEKNVQIMKEGPHYNLVKYLLAMDTKKCNVKINDFKKILGQKFEYDSYKDSLLMNYGKIAGLQDIDWTMNYLSDEKNPKYQVGDRQFSEHVRKVILSEIGKEDLYIKEKLHEVPVFADDQALSCLKMLAPDDVYMCSALQFRFDTEYEKFVASGASLEVTCQKNNVLEVIDYKLKDKLKTDMDDIITKVDEQSISRGRALVQENSKGKCVTCHSSGAKSGLSREFRFIPNESDSKANQDKSHAILQERASKGLLRKVHHRLVETKTMPPIENTLTDEDRMDVEAYIKSIAK